MRQQGKPLHGNCRLDRKRADAGAAESGGSRQVNGCRRERAPTEPLKPKYDVRLIGQREVAGGVNFYSLDREMALGRDLSKAGGSHLQAGHRSGG